MKTPNGSQIDTDIVPLRTLRRKILAKKIILTAVLATVIVLYLMVTDAIPWRSGSLEDIYACDSYELDSVYVFTDRDGDVFFSTERNDLDRIRDTFINLDWHAIGGLRGSERDPRGELQLYVVYQNSNGDEKGLWIHCTGDDTINIFTSDAPLHRKRDMDYQVSGGYDLSWLYK